MKIGVLTFHRPANFGANLQAYATTCLIKDAGHDVKVIDYLRLEDMAYKNNIPLEQYQAHQKFVETHLPLTRQISEEVEIPEVVIEEKFDAIIVGADAVWRKPKDNNIYFCQWLKDNPRLKNVAIASLSPAHMGNGFKDLDSLSKSRIKDDLLRFNFITVRDSWTGNVINRDIFDGEGFNYLINPDPVIILSDFVKHEKLESRGIELKKYFLMTLPHNWCKAGKLSKLKLEWFRKFKGIVNEAGFSLVELPLPEGESGLKFDYTVRGGIDPIQWFLWIKNAKAFCGLRFHAIVSSISCGTPFFSMDSYGDNSRISIALDLLRLHSIARKRDSKSKIFQLLANTGMSGFRTGQLIETESPAKIFRMLNSINEEQVLTLRREKASIFTSNFSKLLEAIKHV